jgi:hypothetical protein
MTGHCSARGEGKGREGKGKEGKGKETTSAGKPAHVDGGLIFNFSVRPTAKNKRVIWNPTAAQVSRWLAAYPELDLSAQLSRMHAWLEDNPSKRKTLAGMPRFVGAWLARSDTARLVTSASREKADGPEHKASW